MTKKSHIQILCFFWPIYLIIFLLIGLKLILSIIGLVGTIATIILIKKNKNDEFSTLKKNLCRILYCIIPVFSIFLFVKITGLVGFNWLYFSIFFIIDYHFFYFINWTPWKKREKKENKKGKVREWVESILFAIFAATLIHIFTIQPYIIPTSSLEGTLLRGDFLFVSKFNYGSNVPNTPLFLPFMHNKLPFTENTPSYLDWVQLGYNRLPGFQEIKNNDIVVFNWPTDQLQKNMPFDKKTNYVKRCVAIPGDFLEIKNGTLILNDKIQNEPNRGIIQHAYWLQYDNVTLKKNKNGTFKTKDDLKKELHNKYEVELCDIGIQGKIGDQDGRVLSYQNLLVWGSEEEIAKIKDADTIIRVEQNIICAGELQITKNRLERLCNDTLCKINHTKKNRLFSESFPTFTLNKYNMGDQITSLFPQPFQHKVVVTESCSKECKETCKKPKNTYNETQLFQLNHDWDNDNYGPIYLPKKGDTITLNEENLALYGEIITNYENNELVIHEERKIHCLDDSLLVKYSDYQYTINDKKTNKYTIKMDRGYYWMMGDNRHNSQDSRCWGFVPFNHVVGKPLLIWLSIDWNADNWFNKIRWKRLFTTVHGDGESRWYFPYFIIILLLFIFRKRFKRIIKPILKKEKTIEKTSD